MSLSSLVAAVPGTYFRNPSSSFLVSRSIHERGRVRAHVGRKSPGAICNAGPMLMGSSFLGVSGLDRVWRERSSGKGIDSGSVKTRGSRRGRDAGLEARATGLPEAIVEVMEAVKAGWATNPPTWESAFVSMGSIFVVGAPALVVGLTKTGMAAAYLLGSIIWRAYGLPGLLTIILFYLIGTTATKLKMKEKQKEGIAEKRSGRRGVASVLGSGTAAAICALCSIYGIGGPEISPLWQLGYLASLCTKLSDTISSEIGKAYGKTTYLVTTLSVVPRGTEGAVSLEGTVAGVVAAVFLAATSYSLNQVDQCGAIIAVGASQIANLFESFLGATLQGRPGYEWLSNDIVNVANVTVGATLAILMKKILY